jgi:hypothetical protein
MIDGLAGGKGDIGDAEVDVVREPPVELDLAMAGPFPPLARGEIQEAEIHRFLQLEGSIADEEDHAGVCLRDARGQDVHRLGSRAAAAVTVRPLAVNAAVVRSPRSMCRMTPIAMAGPLLCRGSSMLPR